MCLLLKIESPRMPMILYSLDSIFRKESESAIRIDMQALVLNLLKIEICCQIISEKAQKTRNVSRINNMFSESESEAWSSNC
jgi:hypothetical protein